VELRNRNQSAILRGGNHRRLLVIIRLPELEFQRLSRLRRQSCTQATNEAKLFCWLTFTYSCRRSFHGGGSSLIGKLGSQDWLGGSYSHLQWEQVDKASVQHVNGDGRLVGFSLPWLKMMTLISEREDAGCIKKWWCSESVCISQKSCRSRQKVSVKVFMLDKPFANNYMFPHKGNAHTCRNLGV
jgi:hypothetical protein